MFVCLRKRGLACRWTGSGSTAQMRKSSPWPRSSLKTGKDFWVHYDFKLFTQRIYWAVEKLFVLLDVEILWCDSPLWHKHADSGNSHAEKPAEGKNGLDSDKTAVSPNGSPCETQSRSVLSRTLCRNQYHTQLCSLTLHLTTALSKDNQEI